MPGEKQPDEKKERRTHIRETLVTRVAYKILMNSKGETLTQNISEGGLCLILDRKISPGAGLELSLNMLGKDAKPIEILAEVVWQKKTEMGFLTGLKLKLGS